MIKVGLSIAGLDPSAGAGLLVDLRVFWRLGIYGLGLCSALTVQNTMQVGGITSVPAEFLAGQLDALIEDFSIDCLKVGMIHDQKIARVLARFLSQVKIPIVVLDPVLRASAGPELTSLETMQVVQDELLPLVQVITPNVPEAEILLGRCVSSLQEGREAARELAVKFGVAVVLKGGHWSDGDQGQDVACCQDQLQMFQAPALSLPPVHGTGCVFSSALAAYLAKGQDFWGAVSLAKNFVRLFMQRAMPLGQGSLLGYC